MTYFSLLFLRIHEVRMLLLLLFYIAPSPVVILKAQKIHKYSEILSSLSFVKEEHFQQRDPSSTFGHRVPQCVRTAPSASVVMSSPPSPIPLPASPLSHPAPCPFPPAVRGQRPVLLVSDHCRSAADDITDLEVVRWAGAEPLELIVQTDRQP